MTIERDGREQYFECDTPGCMASFPIEDNDWSRSWQRAKLKGWETKKIGKDWLHTCPKHML